MRTRLFPVAVLAASFSAGAAAQWDWSGELSLETRIFPERPAYPDQDRATVSPSVAVQPELRYEWAEGANRLTFIPFGRLDAHDDSRSHFDVRELNYLHLRDTWDIKAGLSKVFWGVTESVHLVDIVNQTDFVEDVDNEDKLGQPMVNLNLLRDWGTLSFFVLPGFRERTFPGDKARRRGPFRIDASDATYESGAEERHVDGALRWSHFIGNWDMGVSYFHGTSRKPRLLPEIGLSGIRLTPHYDQIDQIGADIQYTFDAWLLKFEAIMRWGHGRPFFATVAGFEYTFFQIFGTNADLGVLAEYQFDDRSKTDAPIVISDNDVFVGARLALNDEYDTSMLAGLVVDTNYGSLGSFIEAERRLSNHWKVELEARLLFNVHERDPAFVFRKDDSITLRLTYSF